MADVTSDIDRGQIIIVAGLLLAVVFVGLALIVNSAIFAENLATRDTGAENSEPLQQRELLESRLGRTVDRTNANIETTSGSTLQDELEKALANQSSTYIEAGAKRGQIVDVSTNSPTEGARLRQTNESRNFSSAEGATNWTLTNGIPEGGQFAMNMQKGSLFQATLDTTMALLGDSAFAIEFETGSGVWRIYIFRGAATESVYAVVETDDQEFQASGLETRTNPDHIVDGWLNQSCALQGDTVSMRLGEEQFGGANCEEFSFYNEIEAHNVSFANVKTDGIDRGTGTYDILVGTTNYNTSAFEPVGNGQPFYQAAMYSFNYTYTYRSDGTTYTVPNRTVKPQEADSGGILWEHPRVESFNVTGSTANSPNDTFDVEWQVSHPNARLDRVELELVEVSVEKTESEVENEVDRATDDPAFEELLGALGFNTYFNDYEDTINNTRGFPINLNRVVDNKTVSVSGASGTGANTLSHDGLGTDYRLQITVIDESGRATTAVKACEAGSTDCEVVG
jgi:hypothetical protein